jgi:hypothetical protein
MGWKFSKISRGKNLPGTIKEAATTDILFIGGYKKLIQWSVSQKKVTKDYGNIMAANISSMVQTSDKNYLFLGSEERS